MLISSSLENQGLAANLSLNALSPLRSVSKKTLDLNPLLSKLDISGTTHVLLYRTKVGSSFRDREHHCFCNTDAKWLLVL